MPLGLYVHVPFCGSICNYCNFNRGLFDAALKDRYVRALQREIRTIADRVNGGMHAVIERALTTVRRSEGPRVRGSAANDLRTSGPSDLRTSVDTIYFGGGTPSLLTPDEIGSIVDACRAAFAVADDAEVTLEANPETVTAAGMAAYRDAGVNRVSMGVQSFRDAELRRLGRVHDAARARAAFEAARAAGFDNVSLDLMLWLPQQTVEDCLFSVRSLAALGPEHASLYLLELYPNAPLKEEMARSGWSLAPDEDAAEMYLGAIDVLAEAGYRQYEISNFARPGLESRHNLKYWNDGEWLAFGCGAHSTLDGVRWKNMSATDLYVADVERDGVPGIAERRDLTAEERFQEAVFMGLRLVKGLDLPAIRARYGVDLWQEYGERLVPFLDAGLLVAGGAPGGAVSVAGSGLPFDSAQGRQPGTPGRLHLSPRGLLLSNEVMSVFIGPRVR